MITAQQAEALQQSLQGSFISEKEAKARANRFILDNLRDGFSAGRPRVVVIGQEAAWSVPVQFAFPERVFGEVGEIVIQAVSGSILGFTPPAELYRNAKQFLT